MAKKASKKKVIPVPQNQEELIEFLKDLNHFVGRKESIQAGAQAKKDEIDRKVAEEVKPIDLMIEEESEGIFLYCQANRAELTQGNKTKTVTIPGGTILWRLNPSSVEVIDEQAAIGELLLKDLSKFVRTKREINKEAILQEKDSLPKLKFLQVKEGDEVFAIKPADVKIELEKGKRKFKSKKL